MWLRLRVTVLCEACQREGNGGRGAFKRRGRKVKCNLRTCNVQPKDKGQCQIPWMAPTEGPGHKGQKQWQLTLSLHWWEEALWRSRIWSWALKTSRQFRSAEGEERRHSSQKGSWQLGLVWASLQLLLHHRLSHRVYERSLPQWFEVHWTPHPIFCPFLGWFVPLVMFKSGVPGSSSSSTWQLTPWSGGISRPGGGPSTVVWQALQGIQIHTQVGESESWGLLGLFPPFSAFLL